MSTLELGTLRSCIAACLALRLIGCGSDHAGAAGASAGATPGGSSSGGVGQSGGDASTGTVASGGNAGASIGALGGNAGRESSAGNAAAGANVVASGAGGSSSGDRGVAGSASGGSAGGGALLAEDTFTNGLAKWSVELESGGTVTAANGALDVDVPNGVTIWLKQRVEDPIVIQFEATAVSAGGPNDHVTDLNMFWNARDTRSPADLFATKRSGAFGDYDFLKTYYVGFGANLDTTTRMRRYVGEDGNRPLLFDLTAPLLVANRAYRVKLVADGSKVQYWSDEQLLFDYVDAAPYTDGWFAFRTAGSHLRFSDFSIRRPL